MKTSVVTVKGQVVVPANIRRKFGIKRGQRSLLSSRTVSSLSSRSTRTILNLWREYLAQAAIC